ncbi:MAG: hypothetical protein ACI396_09565 [Acutalibacteraceae bacterium]
MKRAVAAIAALIMIICASGCGNIVSEQLPRRSDTYTIVTSWNEKYTITLSDNSVDKSSLSLKIENENGGLVKTALDYDMHWFDSDMAIIRDYNDGTLKAARFKWGILLETADDFYAVMTSEYSDKLRDDELFASVYDAL